MMQRLIWLHYSWINLSQEQIKGDYKDTHLSFICSWILQMCGEQYHESCKCLMKNNVKVSFRSFNTKVNIQFSKMFKYMPSWTSSITHASLAFTDQFWAWRHLPSSKWSIFKKKKTCTPSGNDVPFNLEWMEVICLFSFKQF